MYATFRLSAFLLFMVQLFCNCISDSPSKPDSMQPETPAGIPDAYQDKIRTRLYPRADNELYLNPAPLIAPQAMRTDERLRFSLLRTKDFSDSEALLFEPQEWCMHNLHRRLEVGVWYRCFRSTNLNGIAPGERSAIYRFGVKNGTPEFVTPPLQTFLAGAPRLHPRIYCFLDDRIEEARNRVISHPEHAELQSRASQALKAEYTGTTDLYSRAEELRQHAIYPHQAYHLTQKEIYTEKSRQLLEALIVAPPADGQLFTSNLTASNIAWCLVVTYDLLCSNLSVSSHTAVEELMMCVARYYYKVSCGFQGNHLLDNHFWQQNMRIPFQMALSLHDKPAYSSEMLSMVEYHYELWIARIPASGLNRDGIWHNSTSYFSANILTLAYMSSLLLSISQYDYLSYPWYQNVGCSLVYTCPLGPKNNGLGNNSEEGSEPNRLVTTFADYLTCETDDSYTGWYAGECQELLRRNYELRLYRVCTEQGYNTTFPARVNKMVWYKDAGEVVMHSAPEGTGKDLVLSFRSNISGSGSHTATGQNAFNLLHKGIDVCHSTGYYQNFSGAHNLIFCRHTRVYNSLLINGIRQPYSTESYGSVMRAMDGQHISYCPGDASHTYRGIDSDPTWVGYFKQAGIEQMPENGFGAIPLIEYRRRVLMLHPHTVIVYDELEASEAVRWEWLSHSPTGFKMDAIKKALFMNNKIKGWMVVIRLLGGHVFTLSQTDRFVVSPAITGAEYPNQWHLTTRADGCSTTRFLTIIQVGGGAVSIINRNGDTFNVGSWTIRTVLDASRASELVASHRTGQAAFSYETDSPALNGNFYSRQYTGSSLLYDEVDGTYQVVKMIDRNPISAWVVNQ